MVIYQHDSEFKKGDVWYSGTNKNGENCVVFFKCAVPEQFAKEKAIQITNIMGNRKDKDDYVHEETGEVIPQCTYYVTSCDFDYPPVEQLDD